VGRETQKRRDVHASKVRRGSREILGVKQGCRAPKRKKGKEGGRKGYCKAKLERPAKKSAEIDATGGSKKGTRPEGVAFTQGGEFEIFCWRFRRTLKGERWPSGSKKT